RSRCLPFPYTTLFRSLRVRPVEVADDPLGVRQLGELTEIGLSSQLQWLEAGFVAALGGLLQKLQVTTSLVEHLRSAHGPVPGNRSEEHTSELQSRENL